MYTFLIADDSKMTRITLQAMIESLYKNTTIYLVDDGVKVVEAYRKFSPNVVFMDISMPNRDGLEAARIIMQKDNNANIVMMTSHLGKGMQLEAKALKAKAYLNKPLKIDEINQVLQKIL